MKNLIKILKEKKKWCITLVVLIVAECYVWICYPRFFWSGFILWLPISWWILVRPFKKNMDVSWPLAIAMFCYLPVTFWGGINLSVQDDLIGIRSPREYEADMLECSVYESYAMFPAQLPKGAKHVTYRNGWDDIYVTMETSDEYIEEQMRKWADKEVPMVKAYLPGMRQKNEASLQYYETNARLFMVKNKYDEGNGFWVDNQKNVITFFRGARIVENE